MQIIHSLEELSHFLYPVIAIGNFDGVHAGHQKLIQTVLSRAKENNGASVVITFNPNTKVFFGNITEQDLIYTPAEKIHALENLGVDVCVVLDFASIKDMTAEEFVHKILVEKIGIKEFVVGYDTNFGNDRKGDKENLLVLGEKYGFTLTEVEPLMQEGHIVSSTFLRQNTEK